MSSVLSKWTLHCLEMVVQSDYLSCMYCILCTASLNGVAGADWSLTGSHPSLSALTVNWLWRQHVQPFTATVNIPSWDWAVLTCRKLLNNDGDTFFSGTDSVYDLQGQWKFFAMGSFVNWAEIWWMYVGVGVGVGLHIIDLVMRVTRKKNNVNETQ